MKATLIKNLIASLIFASGFLASSHAQEYVSPTGPVATGKSPGVKVKLLSTNGQTKNYVLVFAPGDEVRSGLTEFAQKYNVKSAHYTAIGDVITAKVGWYDYNRKMFKVILIDTAEITSFTGNITTLDGKAVAHTHISAATSDGLVHGGHLLESIVGPTLEVFITVEPTPLHKKMDKRFEAALIDPAQ